MVKEWVWKEHRGELGFKRETRNHTARRGALKPAPASWLVVVRKHTDLCGQPNRTFLAIYPRLSKARPRHLTAFTGEKSWSVPPSDNRHADRPMNTRPCVPLLSEPQPPSQTTTINMGEEQRASPPAPPPPTEAEVTAEEEVQARAAQGVPNPLREPPGVLRWFLRTEQGRVQKKKH